MPEGFGAGGPGDLQAGFSGKLFPLDSLGAGEATSFLKEDSLEDKQEQTNTQGQAKHRPPPVKMFLLYSSPHTDRR